MRIGSWQVDTVWEGSFLLDGGSMFGIVPRTLWARYHQPDEHNRILMALRTLLLRGHDRCILVDCGIGPRFAGRQAEIYAYQERAGGLLAGLEQLGVVPEQVTDVVASHLHFDHMAGLLRPDREGRLVPAFPAARLHLQKDGWEWAHDPSDWDRASFFREDFPIWERELDLRLLRGEEEIAPGITVQPAAGHMPGHQVVVVQDGGQGLVYCADLVPTATHVKLPYIMAYDHRPLLTLEDKKVLLARALEEDWLLVFEHDPRVAACRLEEKRGQVVVGQTLEL